MSALTALAATPIPLAHHTPDHLALAVLLYFGPVVALVAFLVFLHRRGRGRGPGEDEEPEDERPSEAEEATKAGGERTPTT